MADTKISALTSATTPLAGTEVLPIVQGGVTVKVAVSDLTAGRAISATQITLTTGNLIVANGQGVDFSATPGTGTSELLADYEEGTFTPTDNSGASLSLTQSGQATYVKAGKLITCTMDITYPVTASTATASIAFPFVTATSSSFVGQVGYQTLGAYVSPSGDNVGFVFWNIAGATQTNVSLSGKRLQISFTYRTAT
jgi:hypothetical protein